MKINRILGGILYVDAPTKSADKIMANTTIA